MNLVVLGCQFSGLTGETYRNLVISEKYCKPQSTVKSLRWMSSLLTYNEVPRSGAQSPGHTQSRVKLVCAWRDYLLEKWSKLCTSCFWKRRDEISRRTSTWQTGAHPILQLLWLEEPGPSQSGALSKVIFFLLLFVCLFLVLEGPAGFIIEQKCAPVSCYQWILVPCPKESQNPLWFSLLHRLSRYPDRRS